MTTPLRRAASGALSLLPLAPFLAALQAQPTHADYARAEQLLPWNVQETLWNDAVRPRWLPGDRFWYRNRGAKGWEFLVVEMATGAKRPAILLEQPRPLLRDDSSRKLCCLVLARLADHGDERRERLEPR